MSSRATRGHGEATRRAVRAWGLEILCADPEEYSNSLTAVLLAAGHDADKVRQIILERFDMSLGAGLGKMQGKVFRIGHLGDFNDLMLAGTLCGVEMGLRTRRRADSQGRRCRRTGIPGRGNRSAAGCPAGERLNPAAPSRMRAKYLRLA